MRTYVIGASVILSLAIAFSVFLLTNSTQHMPLLTIEEEKHRSYSSDPTLYAIVASSTFSHQFNEPVLGGILSHHLLSNIDISHFFAEFTDQHVERVIIVGPNHYYPTAPSVLSTLRHYETPFGDVRTDTSMIENLAEEGLTDIDPHTLEEEHSISSLVPYVQAYFPNARIVPLIISARADTTVLDRLAAYISQHSDETTIVVSSVDFSHHLYSNSAHLHDERSIAAIKNFDYESLQKLEVDSPNSLRILLKYLEQKGAQKMTVNTQSSANIFDTYDAEDVTSYVFAHAVTGEREEGAGVSALFFGDAMLGSLENVTTDTLSAIRGPEGNFLKGYDAVSLNLEGALERTGCSQKDDEILIAPDRLSILAPHRFTHANVVNNHFQRCPLDSEGNAILQENKLTPITSAGTAVQGTNAQMGLISFFTSPIPPDTSVMVEQVRYMAKKFEVVVVNLHWGVEYNTVPSHDQRELAHALIDAGADVLIGHHPHAVQPVERYQNGIIFYSLGNFISDQVGELTQTGFAVGIIGSKEGITASVFPFTQEGGTPVHMTQSAARGFCEKHIVSGTSFQSPNHPCLLRITR